MGAFLMVSDVGVLHVCNELGLGGTERGIVSMCRFMRYGVFRHAVLCLASAGPRAPALAGVAEVRVHDGDGATLRRLLEEGRFAVVILHRAGRAQARWSEVLRACRELAVPAVFEVNIFGEVDTSAEDGVIDWHLHISKSSYCNLRRTAQRRRYARLQRHRVLYIPLDVADLAREAAPGDRGAARARLGLSDGEFVLLRTGRPDCRKWGDLLMDAVPRVLRAIPEARFVFLSAPSTRAWYMARRHGRRVLVLPATTDDSVLADAYRAADVYVHSSRRGESLGASLIEAMASGLPVVVDSTPWRDNAQVEVVDHMRTGIIANRADAFADALVALHRDAPLRDRMGGLAREKAMTVYDARVVCRSLANLVAATLRAKGIARPALEAFGGPTLPELQEIEQYWRTDGRRREGEGWQGIAPRRLRSPFRQAAWLAVDALDIAMRKSRFLRA